MAFALFSGTEGTWDLAGFPIVSYPDGFADQRIPGIIDAVVEKAKGKP